MLDADQVADEWVICLRGPATAQWRFVMLAHMDATMRQLVLKRMKVWTAEELFSELAKGAK